MAPIFVHAANDQSCDTSLLSAPPAMCSPRDQRATRAAARRAARPPVQVCKELADVFEKEVLPRLVPAVRPGSVEKLPHARLSPEWWLAGTLATS
jgi:hypothetical protein